MRKWPCKLVSVLDGDTLVVDVDLGFGVIIRQRVRVLDLETYELRGEDHLIAKDVARQVHDWLGRPGSALEIEGRDFDLYGRFLAHVRKASGADLATWMKGRGIGWGRSGHGRRPQVPSGG